MFNIGIEVRVIDRRVVDDCRIAFDSKQMYPHLIGKEGVVRYYEDDAYNTDRPTGYERATYLVEIDGKEHEVDSVHVVEVCQVCKHMGCRGGEHTRNVTCLCK